MQFSREKCLGLLTFSIFRTVDTPQRPHRHTGRQLFILTVLKQKMPACVNYVEETAHFEAVGSVQIHQRTDW